MRLLGFFVAGCCVLSTAACSSDVQTPGGGAGGTGGSDTTASHASSVHSATHAASSSGTGIGEPSDTYPAPHSAPPKVVSFGGPVLATPRIVPVLFSSDAAATRQGITDFIQALETSSYWTSIAAEYGVGAPTMATPVVLDETIPSQISDDDIQFWLSDKLNTNDPAFPQPDGNSIYAIFYVDGITITEGGDQSCQSFGGYHYNVQLDAAHANQLVAYAVMPRCGNFAGLGGLDALSAVASHEYIEASTDPYPASDPAFAQTDNASLAWTFTLGGGEVGDMCAQFSDVFTTYPDLAFYAQRSWSNASALAGHDPCVPIPGGEVYFNAAPKMPDNINIGQGASIKGVTIAEGESKTIELDLFSDGPTEPFDVQAFQANGFGGGGGGNGDLSLDLDETSGQNGQTLHLTITVNQASQFGLETFFVSSSLNGRQNLWVGAVGN